MLRLITRVCGQRITKYRAKKSISYECKAFSAELKIAFDINTSGDDVNIHSEMFCMHLILFEWEKHTDQECKPLELLCGALVCTKCLQEWIATSGAVNCPCCSEGGPLVSSHVRPAPDCSRDVKAGDYEGHECVPSLTPEEEKQAARLLKRAISTSPDKGIHPTSYRKNKLADLPGIFPSTARHCKGFPCSKETLKTAQHSQEVLQQVATCVALVHGQEDPLAVDLLKQSAAKKKSVKALNFIDAAQAHALDQAIQEFMAFFQDTYPEATVPIKKHLLEDHTVQWANTNHVGFGLLGEQGDESIHAKFNRLGLAFAPIKDHVQNLMCTSIWSLSRTGTDGPLQQLSSLLLRCQIMPPCDARHCAFDPIDDPLHHPVHSFFLGHSRQYTGDEDKDDQRLCVVEHKAISPFEEEDDAIDELMSPDDSTLLDGEYVDSESEEYQEDDDNDA
eukprot:Em0012g282a